MLQTANEPKMTKSQGVDTKTAHREPIIVRYETQFITLIQHKLCEKHHRVTVPPLLLSFLDYSLTYKDIQSIDILDTSDEKVSELAFASDQQLNTDAEFQLYGDPSKAGKNRVIGQNL